MTKTVTGIFATYASVHCLVLHVPLVNTRMELQAVHHALQAITQQAVPPSAPRVLLVRFQHLQVPLRAHHVRLVRILHLDLLHAFIALQTRTRRRQVHLQATAHATRAFQGHKEAPAAHVQRGPISTWRARRPVLHVTLNPRPALSIVQVVRRATA